MSIKKNSKENSKTSIKKNSNFTIEENDYNLLQRLKIDVLINTNLLDINDFNKNEYYFKNNIFNKKNNNLNRSWLIHLLGGEISAKHFFKKNGELNNNNEIEKKILKLLSWKGTELNDYYIYEKIYKKIYKNYGYMIKYISYFKKINLFIETLVSSFFLIHKKDKKDNNYNTNMQNYIIGITLGGTIGIAELFNIIIKNKTISYIFKLLFNLNTQKPLSLISLSNAKLMIIIYLILNILNAVYTSYYFNIEQEHINKFLKDGLNDTHRIQINKFKELYYDFDLEVFELSNKKNEELLYLIDKYYDTFFSFFLDFKKENNLKFYLKEGLKNKLKINEFYKIIINISYIYPFAIYFFKQNGDLRTTRDCVCSIINILMGDNSNIKEKLKKSNVIAIKRQNNL